MNVIVKITPHEDEKRCGSCNVDGAWCCKWSVPVGDESPVYFMRGPECLAAEQKLKRLVEAGNHLAEEKETLARDRVEWNAAVAALEDAT